MSSHFSRRIFFWFLTALFLISSILIVVYSFGYRFNKKRGIFIYTGSITIKSVPRKIHIVVDTKNIPSRRINFFNYAYHINSITPGNHSLIISAKNHQTWHKNIIVHSGISTEFWNVFLAKNQYKEQFYPSSLSLKDFFISPSNKKIALVEKNLNKNLLKIEILEIKGKLPQEFKTQLAFSGSSYNFISNNKENIEWTPNNKQVIIPLIEIETSLPHYFIFNTENNKLLDLTQKLIDNKFSPNNIHQARWDGKNQNKLFFLANNNLYYLDLNKLLESKNYQPNLLIKNILAYDISDGSIYFISQKDKKVHKVISNNYKETKIINSKAFNSLSDNLSLVVYDKNRLFVNDLENKKICFYNKSGEKTYQSCLNQEIEDAQFSDDGKKLLFWNKNEIYVYFTRDWKTQPFRSENEIENLTRFSQKIHNVQWYKDYEHVIFEVNNEIKIIELDYRSYRNLQTLIKLNQTPSKITYNSFEERLYYPNQHNNLDNLSFISLKDK